jgi:formylglycine-generating enzyme required for sulfatase activity
MMIVQRSYSKLSMNKITKWFSISLFLILFTLESTSPCEGGRKTKIGVMKFDVSRDIEPSIGSFLYNSLVGEMQASQKYTIVDWEEIDRVINSIAKSHPNISVKEARKQAINQVGIQETYVGSVTIVDTKYQITTRVLNPDLTVEAVVKQSTGSEDGLEGCIMSVAHLLLIRLADAEKFEGTVEKHQASDTAAKATGLPSWLVPVKDAKYAVLLGLAPGSREAQERQRRTVEELKLPLEVKMRKAGITFRLVPAGSFIMGSPWAGSVRDVNEGPIRQVNISKPMYVGKFEITQGQWEAFKEVGKDAPVENVSWKECQEFCLILEQSEASQDISLRLLTEAEWEYSCRAGTVGPYIGDIHWMGWYHGNGGEKTHRVGEKAPNAWGLYDMHGNVLEWCQDWHRDSYPPEDVTDPLGPQTGSDRVLRGGSWYHVAALCSSAYRFWEKPTYSYEWTGFRIAMPAVQ